MRAGANLELGRIVAIRLSWRFFRGDPLDVARRLIGKRLVVVGKGRRLAGRITETEAYIGTEDPASHAFHGHRGANDSMYGAPGTAYVYFTYGVHFMLNIVLGPRDYPCAILIRALMPEEGIDVMKRNRKTDKINRLASGPGNLCRAFGIDKRLDGCNFFGHAIWIEATRLQGAIKTSGRIGIGDRGAELPWRFYLAGHTSVSGPSRLRY